ncbi:MAG TPA: prepilin-type N-terminal cleavage/methylation domain-containing protein, partial [Gemmatirosa sp.]
MRTTRRLAPRSANRKGFTLIELLIVVVIIGILAAVAIPKFATTKDKAYIANMKSDLKNLSSVEESFFSDSNRYGATAEITAALYRFTA